MQHKMCCSYGSDGLTGSMGYDCLNIPGAENDAGVMVRSNLCGRSNGIVTDSVVTPVVSTTICCKKTFLLCILYKLFLNFLCKFLKLSSPHPILRPVPVRQL